MSLEYHLDIQEEGTERDPHELVSWREGAILVGEAEYAKLYEMYNAEGNCGGVPLSIILTTKKRLDEVHNAHAHPARLEYREIYPTSPSTTSSPPFFELEDDGLPDVVPPLSPAPAPVPLAEAA